MSQQISTFLANMWLDVQFGQNQTLVVPASYLVRLWLVSPGVGNSGGVEVPSTGGTNYSPLSFANNPTNFSPASNRTKNNINQVIPWFTAGASFGPIVAVTLHDSNGNEYIINDIPSGSQQSAVAGNPVGFSIGDFSVSIN